jgi:small subunit ribosomal protein S20
MVAEPTTGPGRAGACDGGGRGPVRSPSPVETTSDAEEPVANIKSQIKRNRQNETRRLRNKTVRSEVRTRTKAAVAAAESGADTAEESLRLALKRIDKAASKGVIHKNQAARRKSRLVKRIAASSEA